jgi:hypothetical protein
LECWLQPSGHTENEILSFIFFSLTFFSLQDLKAMVTCSNEWAMMAPSQGSEPPPAVSFPLDSASLRSLQDSYFLMVGFETYQKNTEMGFYWFPQLQAMEVAAYY